MSVSLFAPPALVETEVYASLPDELRIPSRIASGFAEGQPPGSAMTSVLEGPSFDKEGNLWCVDIPNGRVLKLDKNRQFHLVCEYDGWPNGLKIHRDGRIFIADYKHGIMLLDPVNGHVEPYLVRANMERFKAVNDLFFAANGDLFFTDQGLTGLHDPTGRVFRLKPDGTVTCLVDNVPSPNGLVMNLDERALYVAATRGNAIWRLPIQRDGSTAKVGIFIQLSGGGGPDGIALTADGGLVVGHIGLGAIWVFDAVGQPLYRVQSCKGWHTTNIAFGGAENRDLFITESASGTILRAKLPLAGKPMFSHS
jgi:gluconolactonase